MKKPLFFYRQLLAAFTVISALLINASAYADNTHEVINIEFDGIRLGMSPEQTTEALLNSLPISEQDYQFSRSTNPLSGISDSVFGIMYSSDTLEVKAIFYPDVKNDAAENMVLQHLRIAKAIDKAREETSYSHNAELAVQNFGEPTYFSSQDVSWCAKVQDDGERCDRNELRASVSYSATFTQKYTVFILADPTARTAFNDALNK